MLRQEGCWLNTKTNAEQDYQPFSSLWSLESDPACDMAVKTLTDCFYLLYTADWHLFPWVPKACFDAVNTLYKQPIEQPFTKSLICIFTALLQNSFRINGSKNVESLMRPRVKQEMGKWQCPRMLLLLSWQLNNFHTLALFSWYIRH